MPDPTAPRPQRLWPLFLGCGLAVLCVAALAFVGLRWLDRGLVSPRHMEITLEAFHAWQEQFKRQDPERDGKQDYGTIEELARAKLIGAHLEDGSNFGYRFELALTPARDRWMMVANPLDEESRKYPSFLVGIDGKVWASRTRLGLDPECVVPPGLDLAGKVNDWGAYMSAGGG